MFKNIVYKPYSPFKLKDFFNNIGLRCEIETSPLGYGAKLVLKKDAAGSPEIMSIDYSWSTRRQSYFAEGVTITNNLIKLMSQNARDFIMSKYRCQDEYNEAIRENEELKIANKKLKTYCLNKAINLAEVGTIKANEINKYYNEFYKTFRDDEKSN